METGVLGRIKRILMVAFPLVIQGIVFQLQSLTDKAFLGNLDTRYVSAIGSAQMPYNAVGDSLIAISIGVTIMVSRLFGAKKKEDLKGIVKSSIFYNTLLGIVVCIFWQTSASSVLSFFQVALEVKEYAVTYIKICSFYMILIGIDSSLQAFLQGIGDTKPIMIAGIIKVILNMLFSWILIFGKFGVPALYVTGAAIGTLLANIVACLFVIIYCLFYKNKIYQMRTKSFDWIDLGKYVSVLRIGIPSGLEYLLWNLSNLVLVRFINEFSYQSMAIYSITFGCQCLVYVTFSASSKAALTIMGHSLGAEIRDEADRIFQTCILLNVIIVGIAALLFISYPEGLLGIFTNDQEVIAKGVPYLIFLGFIMFPQSLNVICGSGIKAKGDTRWMLVSQIIGSSLTVSISWILIRAFEMDMMAIYITLFIDESVRGLINYIHYKKI